MSVRTDLPPAIGRIGLPGASDGLPPVSSPAANTEIPRDASSDAATGGKGERNPGPRTNPAFSAPLIPSPTSDAPLSTCGSMAYHRTSGKLRCVRCREASDQRSWRPRLPRPGRLRMLCSVPALRTLCRPRTHSLWRQAAHCPESAASRDRALAPQRVSPYLATIFLRYWRALSFSPFLV